MFHRFFSSTESETDLLRISLYVAPARVSTTNFPSTYGPLAPHRQRGLIVFWKRRTLAPL
jgi:hypothetical protein